MKTLFLPRFFRCVTVFTDGAIRTDRGVSGLGAIAMDDRGQIRYWWSRQAGMMTNNEAEYAAVILALESLIPYHVQEVTVYSDSQILVHQMIGLATARSPRLQHAQARVRALLVHYRKVRFQYIPREQNRLADALANEAADGRSRS